MKAEFRERKQAIRNFMQAHYTDERLAMLLGHAQEGKLSADSCCCFIGVVNADHPLKNKFVWYGKLGHYHQAFVLAGAPEAENAFSALCDWRHPDDAKRRRILIPMIRTEMRRRDRAKQACELVCTETTV